MRKEMVERQVEDLYSLDSTLDSLRLHLGLTETPSSCFAPHLALRDIQRRQMMVDAVGCCWVSSGVMGCTLWQVYYGKPPNTPVGCVLPPPHTHTHTHSSSSNWQVPLTTEVGAEAVMVTEDGSGRAQEGTESSGCPPPTGASQCRHLHPNPGPSYPCAVGLRRWNRMPGGGA